MNQDSISRLVEVLQKQNEFMLEAFDPERHQYLIKRMPTSEVKDIYYFGSPLGKKMAKAELKRRGIDKRNFFQKLFNL